VVKVLLTYSKKVINQKVSHLFSWFQKGCIFGVFASEKRLKMQPFYCFPSGASRRHYSVFVRQKATNCVFFMGT